METSSRKQSFSQALSSAVPEVDRLTGTWARVEGAVLPLERGGHGQVLVPDLIEDPG